MVILCFEVQIQITCYRYVGNQKLNRLQLNDIILTKTEQNSLCMY